MEVGTLCFDPADLAGMQRLMDQYGEHDGLHVGKNENDETVHITIYSDMIAVTTFQHNSWTRKNIYYRDGTREELFEGKWR